MIQKGILALMIIAAINSVLMVSGFVGDLDNNRALIPGLPQGLLPTGFNESNTDLDFTSSGVSSTESDLVTSALGGIASFIFSIPLLGTLLDSIVSVIAMMLDFMFYWAIALNSSGLPPELVYIISVPIAFFEYGVLLFLAFSFLSSFVTSRGS